MENELKAENAKKWPQKVFREGLQRRWPTAENGQKMAQTSLPKNLQSESMMGFVISPFALPFLVIGSAGKPQTPISAALLRAAAWSCSAAPCKLMGRRQRRMSKSAYLVALSCRVRPAHPENSSEPASRENLCGNFLWIVWSEFAQVLCFTVFGKGFKKIHQRFQVKPEEKSTENPRKNPRKSPPKKSAKRSARKSARKSAEKPATKSTAKSEMENTHLPAAVIAEALQLVCATSLARSGCSTGTKQALSDAKFTAKSAKTIHPDPLQSFRVDKNRKMTPDPIFSPFFLHLGVRAAGYFLFFGQSFPIFACRPVGHFIPLLQRYGGWDGVDSILMLLFLVSTEICIHPCWDTADTRSLCSVTLCECLCALTTIISQLFGDACISINSMIIMMSKLALNQNVAPPTLPFISSSGQNTTQPQIAMIAFVSRRVGVRDLCFSSWR